MKVKEILEICKPVWKDNPAAANNHSPFISILLPTFRRAKSGLLENCLKSILNQTFEEWELIIIDDASTDGSEDIIKKYMELDSRIKCIRHTYNIGLPAISEYEGFIKSEGEYIAFIFDDCVWNDDYLAKTVAYIKDNPHVECCYGEVKSYFSQGENDYVLLGKSSPSVGTHTLSIMNYIPNSGVIMSRGLINNSNVGLYDPHLAQTRLCDWALWKRINNSCTLYETNIDCGKELGVSTKDSLGNTYELHMNTALEREEESKIIDFTPTAFENIDIEYASGAASQSYKYAIKSLKDNFKTKKWYCPEKLQSEANRKIICVIGAIDASVQISLEAYAKSVLSFEYMFRFVGVPDDVADLLQADALICVRSQKPGNIDWIYLCERYNIPCYYFTDDNFEILAENYPYDYIQNEALLWTEDRLRKFDGILTTSENLKKYFIADKRIEEKRVYLIPCTSPETFIERNKSNDIVTFAFLGGQWRNRYFIENFLPLLINLSGNMDIRLICSNDNEFAEIDVKNLEVINIPRRLNLGELLREVRRYKPNFLIHCGHGQPNDKYKNINALWNALSIGAVLIVNNIDPYRAEDLQHCLVRTTMGQDFMDLINNHPVLDDYWDSIYNSASNYCIEKHSLSVNNEVFNSIFGNLKSTNLYTLERRVEKYVIEQSVQMDSIPSAQHKINHSKIDSSKLQLSRLFDNKIKYRILCTVPEISSLSLIFTSFQNNKVSGTVDIKIIYKGHAIREATVSILKIVNNQWVDFSFSNLSGCANKIFDVEILFNFTEETKSYGVYELKTNHTLKRRIVNKLKVNSKASNILFYELH